MADSPPIRRLSTASASSRQEDLINAYEAEEERIINVLSRKLEKVRRTTMSLAFGSLGGGFASYVRKKSIWRMP